MNKAINIGTGGMLAKLKAAQIATSAGIPVVITKGSTANVLERILKGEVVGTYFPVSLNKNTKKKKSI